MEGSLKNTSKTCGPHAPLNPGQDGGAVAPDQSVYINDEPDNPRKPKDTARSFMPLKDLKHSSKVDGAAVIPLVIGAFAHMYSSFDVTG